MCEGLCPSAVIPNEVRLLARRLREVRDRIVVGWYPGLIYAQVGGQLAIRWRELVDVVTEQVAAGPPASETRPPPRPGAAAGGISCGRLQGR